MCLFAHYLLLCRIVKSLATTIGSTIVDLIYEWRVALVGIACMLLMVSSGFIHLVSLVLF